MCDWTCVGLGDVWLDMCVYGWGMCDWTCVCRVGEGGGSDCRVGGCVTGHVCRVGGCVAGHVCIGLGRGGVVTVGLGDV